MYKINHLVWAIALRLKYTQFGVFAKCIIISIIGAIDIVQSIKSENFGIANCIMVEFMMFMI